MNKLTKILLAILMLVSIFGFIACPSNDTSTPANKDIILATTTSVQDSGLLDVLVPKFNKESGFKIKPIAVGSGEAMAMGKRGDADVLVVHSPKDEEAFMKEGLGKSRQLIMTNTYIIVGPSEDPAGCLGTKSAAEALGKIANAKSIFVSRADKSGTHKKELSLWNKSAITPTGETTVPAPPKRERGEESRPNRDEWYIQAQTGMGAVLQITNEKNGYTLTDRGTYLAFKSKIALKIMVEGDKDLINYYSVIVLNPEKFPKMNLAGAEAWAKYLFSPDVTKIIAEFGKDKYGESLFFPSVK